jgi:phosphoglucosamine mutase
LFGGDGFKLPDAVELAMEEEILFHASKGKVVDVKSLPPVGDKPALQSDYIQFLRTTIPNLSLGGMKVVVDCANGAAAAIAPELFRRMNRDGGAKVTLLNVTPDGRNINANCGALHPNFVAAEVRAHGATIGLTFDGDADRCMLADSRGNVINGDAILLMVGRDLKARGLLKADVVVATTMSNMGLEAALKRSAGLRWAASSPGTSCCRIWLLQATGC